MRGVPCSNIEPSSGRAIIVENAKLCGAANGAKVLEGKGEPEGPVQVEMKGRGKPSMWSRQKRGDGTLFDCDSVGVRVAKLAVEEER